MTRRLLFALACIFSSSGAAFAQIPRTGGHPDLQGVWTNPGPGPTLEKGRLGDALVLSSEEARKASAAATKQLQTAPQFQMQADLPDAFSALVVRGENRTRILVEPADGKLPYNPAAQKAVDAYFDAYTRARAGTLANNPEERDLSERCLVSEGQPPMSFTMGTFSRQIVQTADHVMLYAEYFNETRIVRMTGAFNPEPVRSWNGDSIGHWDGDTLVVETRGFRTDMPFHVFVGQKPILTGPDSAVVERFTRVSADELDYAFTVQDPSIYVKPWLGEYAMTRSSDRILEMACHEGNLSVSAALQGARMSELRAERAKITAGK